MPTLLKMTLKTPSVRPKGLLGVPLHGLIFSALERQSLTLSAQVHKAEIKAFRIGQSRWETGEGQSHLSFQLAVLDDALLLPLQQALAPGSLHGERDSTLRGEVQESSIIQQTTYADFYAQHASAVSGRTLLFELLTPTTFRQTDLDMPFPIPKTVFYGLQRRWEAFSDLHFGPELNDWIGRAVRVQDFQLWPRQAHFKGMRGASLTASVGRVEYVIAKPGDAEPTFVRLLADYANYAGLGYKTAYGLGHVEAAGWQHDPRPSNSSVI